MSILNAGLRRLYENVAATGLPVFVDGSIAAMWYGEPRSTLDIDLVIRAGPDDAELFVTAFPEDSFYVPPVEVIRAELKRGSGGQFNVIDLANGLKADIYVAGDDPLIGFGFDKAVEQVTGGVTLNIASATYVVAMKLRFYGISKQDKHLRDIRSVLAISPDAVDMASVLEWATRFGVEDTWRACQESPGEE
ncbi:MAG: hypothetical protein JKY65_11615 [Planctomycetes bacterium]|nr:hypothetical protein [Planctomycetota bacterium]